MSYGSKREETTKTHRHIRKAIILIAISILAKPVKESQRTQQKKPKNNKAMAATPTHAQEKHDVVGPCTVARAPNPSPHTYLRQEPKPVPRETATLEKHDRTLTYGGANIAPFAPHRQASGPVTPPKIYEPPPHALAHGPVR